MSFATAINCMDGRTQLPIIAFLKRKYKVKYVDMITEPGPNKILAENKSKTTLKSIKKRLEISTKKHHSNLIAIIGHHDCAGNSTTKTNQLIHVHKAMDLLKSWVPQTKIIGLWVNENWEVTEV